MVLSQVVTGGENFSKYAPPSPGRQPHLRDTSEKRESLVLGRPLEGGTMLWGMLGDAETHES